jgi:hypothetical protein
MRIHLMGAYSFNMDGQTHRQTDITKLVAAFRIFGNPPNVLGFRTKIICVQCCDGFRKQFKFYEPYVSGLCPSFRIQKIAQPFKTCS